MKLSSFDNKGQPVFKLILTKELSGELKLLPWGLPAHQGRASGWTSWPLLKSIQLYPFHFKPINKLVEPKYSLTVFRILINLLNSAKPFWLVGTFALETQILHLLVGIVWHSADCILFLRHLGLHDSINSITIYFVSVGVNLIFDKLTKLTSVLLFIFSHDLRNVWLFNLNSSDSSYHSCSKMDNDYRLSVI